MLLWCINKEMKDRISMRKENKIHFRTKRFRGLESHDSTHYNIIYILC